jgi:actin-like ATPase involved in cell morphogenesis
VVSPSPGGYVVGIDLGTSNTVAVIRSPDGRRRPVLFDGAPLMPSAVFMQDSGQLAVGRDAQRLAQLDPGRYEPNPKRRIDEPAVLLGDVEIPTVHLLAAVLRAVAVGVSEITRFPPAAVLTYPASWGQTRRKLLHDAAVAAGWPQVSLLPEPVAAARYFISALNHPLPRGSAMAVYDFGGGTIDIAVVRNEERGFTVIGSGGLEDVGGLDIDAALVDLLGEVLRTSEPERWQRMQQPRSSQDRRDRRLFWEDIRGAKEMLSRTTVAPVSVPGVEAALHLTREELERRIGPMISRTVAETARVVQECHLKTDQLAGVMLVGGSSRVPLVARMLHRELKVVPTVLEQPELPVAEGAVAHPAELTTDGRFGVATGSASVGGGTYGGGYSTPSRSYPVTGAPQQGSPEFSGGYSSPTSGGYQAPAQPSPAPVSPPAAPPVPSPVSPARAASSQPGTEAELPLWGTSSFRPVSTGDVPPASAYAPPTQVMPPTQAAPAGVGPATGEAAFTVPAYPQPTYPQPTQAPPASPASAPPASSPTSPTSPAPASAPPVHTEAVSAFPAVGTADTSGPVATAGPVTAPPPHVYGPPTSTTYGGGQPVTYGSPVSGSVSPAVPVSSAPASAAPVSGVPVSGAPVPAAPVSPAAGVASSPVSPAAGVASSPVSPAAAGGAFAAAGLAGAPSGPPALHPAGAATTEAGGHLPPVEEAPPENGSPKAALIAGVVTILIVIAAGLWFILSDRNDSTGTSAPPSPLGQWSKLPDVPTAADGAKVGVEGAGAVVAGGKLYVIGGLAAEDPRPLLDSVWVYDLSRGDTGTWVPGPQLTEPISHMAVALDANSTIWVLGGLTATGATAKVWQLPKDATAWQAGPALPEPRNSGAAVFDGEGIVYGGGTQPGGQATATVWALDGDTWKPAGELSEPREKLAMTTDRTGTIWFVGGVQQKNNNQTFDTVDVMIRRKIDTGEHPKLDHPREGASAMSITGVGLCVLGGHDGPDNFYDWWCADASKTPLLPKQSLARAGMAVAVAVGTVYTVGGYNIPKKLNGTNTVEAFKYN